jgi:hypothetical protein
MTEHVQHEQKDISKIKPQIDATLYLWCLVLPQAASSPVESAAWKSLSSLVFSTAIVQKLWALASKHDIAALTASFEPAKNLSFSDPSMIFILLASVLRIYLIALDDSELYDAGNPADLVEFLPIIKYFKTILYNSLSFDVDLLKEPKLATSADPIDARRLSDEIVTRLYKHHGLKVISSVLGDLHSRWARRPFSSSKLWTVNDADSSRVLRELRAQTPFSLSLLRIMPWAITFHERMKFFREIVDRERLSIQGVDESTGVRSRGTMIKVRRRMLLEDGKTALDKIGGAIKDRIVVRYINDFGEEESGIDAGK